MVLSTRVICASSSTTRMFRFLSALVIGLLSYLLGNVANLYGRAGRRARICYRQKGKSTAPHTLNQHNHRAQFRSCALWSIPMKNVKIACPFEDRCFFEDLAQESCRHPLYHLGHSTWHKCTG